MKHLSPIQIVLVLFTALVVGFCVALLSTNFLNNSEHLQGISASANAAAHPSGPNPSTPNTAPKPNPPVPPTGQGPMEYPNGHQSEEVIQAVLSQNVPIEFYGKVMDQDNHPVSGAEVLLKWREAIRVREDMTSSADKPVTLVSDEYGRFELIGKIGLGVSVEDIKKDGYQLSEQTNRYYIYNAETSVPDQAHPVIFKMWKKQGADRLIVKQKRYGVFPDGRRYTLEAIPKPVF